MQENISLRIWEQLYTEGAFKSADINTQCKAGWYDWFCRDTSLVNKTKILGKRVMQIIDSPKIDKDKMYVFFKNNCPMMGRLYDSFSICDIESHDVVFWVTPSNGHKSQLNKAQVFSNENKFTEPIVEGSWKDVKEWFNTTL